MKKTTLNLCSFLVFLLLGTGLMITGCKKDKSTTTENNYGAIKTDNWRDNIGTEYVVEGYYDEENGIGKLYTDPKLRLYDGLIPQESYILIEKPNTTTYVPDFTPYIGKKIKITGNLKAATEASLVNSAQLSGIGDKSLATLKTSNVSITDSIGVFNKTARFSFCDLYPIFCNGIQFNYGKVAFLYSGGIDASNAHTRYYNDIKALYWLLKNKYGFSDNNIIVCYKDGKNDYISSTNPGDSVKIDYPASKAGLNAAFSNLRRIMGTSTKFFCFINNHGGGYRASNGLYYGGAADTNGDEPSTDSKHYDEDIFYYNETTDIRDDSLASWVNSLTFNTGIFVLKPCFSGGLIYDLRGSNRVIISSGTETQVTYGHSSGNYGEMSHNFIAAISGKVPTTGASVNADTNGDGKVSMYEAFIYLKNAEEFKSDEQPQYNDDGTGTPTTSPSNSGYGASVFLE